MKNTVWGSGLRWWKLTGDSTRYHGNLQILLDAPSYHFLNIQQNLQLLIVHPVSVIAR